MKRFNTKMIAIFAIVLLSTSAYAVKLLNSSSTVLGQASSIKCGNGITCTISGSQVTITDTNTSGPITLESDEIINNTVDDTVEVLSNDNDTTFQITGYEAKEAKLKLYSDQGDDNADKFSIEVSAADVFSIENNGTPLVSISSAGAMTGAGTGALSGFFQKQVAATATTLTAAQCGSTVINSGAVQIELPEASTVLGCRYTFITGNGSNFDVNPDNADQILVLTNAAGDAIRNATLGNSVTIEAISASEWAPVGKEQGTYTDIN